MFFICANFLFRLVQCSEKCGGGDQFRRVMCMRGNEHAPDCKPLTVPGATQACNTHACNAGTFWTYILSGKQYLDKFHNCWSSSISLVDLVDSDY